MWACDPKFKYISETYIQQQYLNAKVGFSSFYNGWDLYGPIFSFIETDRGHTHLVYPF